MNVCCFVGRLVRDPELSHTQNGKPYCKFSIAVNGADKDHPEFFDLVAWDKSAEILTKYRKKGELVSIEARARKEKWEKDGQPRSAIVFHVRGLNLVGNSSFKDTDSTPTPPVTDEPAVTNTDEIPF